MRALATLAIATGLVVAACGGSNDDDAQTSPLTMPAPTDASEEVGPPADESDTESGGVDSSGGLQVDLPELDVRVRIVNFTPGGTGVDVWAGSPDQLGGDAAHLATVGYGEVSDYLPLRATWRTGTAWDTSRWHLSIHPEGSTDQEVQLFEEHFEVERFEQFTVFLLAGSSAEPAWRLSGEDAASLDVSWWDDLPPGRAGFMGLVRMDLLPGDLVDEADIPGLQLGVPGQGCVADDLEAGSLSGTTAMFAQSVATDVGEIAVYPAPPGDPERQLRCDEPYAGPVPFDLDAGDRAYLVIHGTPDEPEVLVVPLSLAE